MLIPVAMLSLVACQQQGGGKRLEPKTEDEKTFYTMGALFGGRLKPLELTDAELQHLHQGLKDSAQGKDSQVDLAKYQMQVQEVFKNRMEKMSGKVKEDGKKYMEKFMKEEGGQATSSGLAYKILKEGTGAKPGAEDTVEVHYHGTLLDGTVFDSSVERDKRVSFPLNRVIKGWTEGLQLVGEGGKIKLVIPSELAYGDHGAPPKIPGGATLIFEVELFSVAKAAPAAPAKKEKAKK
jgi:FKBP-type peptidyl-prolyl cis-trans isomerase FkpA